MKKKKRKVWSFKKLWRKLLQKLSGQGYSPGVRRHK